MKKHLIYAWIVIISMHLFAFVFQCWQGNIYTADSKDYLLKASQLFSAENIEVKDPEFYTKRPPLYPLFIKIAKAVFASDYAVLFLQNIISIFNFFLLFRFFSGFSKTVTVEYKYLWLLVLFTPAQAIYANLIMAEIIFQLFVLLFVIHASAFVAQHRLRHMLISAIFLCLAMLTKPSVYLLAPVFFAAAVYYAIKYRNAAVALTGTLPLLFAIIYMWWNMGKTGYFHFSSIQETNLLHYNTYHLLRDTKGETEADKIIDSITYAADEEKIFAARQKFINAASNKIIMENPARYAKLHLKGTVNQFLDPGRFDLYTFLGLQKEDSAGLLNAFSARGYMGILTYFSKQPLLLLLFLLLIFITQGVKFFLFIKFCFTRKMSWELRLILGGIVLFFALSTGPLGASRFAVPVNQIMLACCALSGFSIWKKNRDKKKDLHISPAQKML
ncbi:MAG: hypothetical protein EOP53_11645 [Sphingobacteriales bacterium]|nr:MAG: hypothetical protein EOP53_11645 [Sphingobacteriales bacterium]